MKKFSTYLALFVGLVLGAFSLSNTTTVKAESSSPLPAGLYDFAVTREAQTTDINGNTTSTVLAPGSTWKINSQYSHGDEVIFQIAPNIFVNQSDGYMYQPSVGTLKVVSNRNVPLYDHNGNLIASRGLAAGSSWYTDRAIFTGKMTYYRVASDEFVCLADVI